MLPLANVVWGARCGESARRVLLGETRSSGHAYSVRGARESAALRQAPHRLPSSRLVSTNLFDLWVEVWRKKVAKGDVIVVRYADDLVVGFQHRTDAERFLGEFRERLAKFGLELNTDKTRLIEFGRFAARDRKQRGEGKPETFTFLGFTHFCGRLTNGAFIVWRITAKKRMVAKLKAIKAELQRRKHHRTTAVGAWLRKVVLGYYQYHAVPGNSTQLRIFSRRVCWLWRSLLIRRSQRPQVRWARLSPLLTRWIPQPRILHPYPDARFAATHPG